MRALSAMGAGRNSGKPRCPGWGTRRCVGGRRQLSVMTCDMAWSAWAKHHEGSVYWSHCAPCMKRYLGLLRPQGHPPRWHLPKGFFRRDTDGQVFFLTKEADETAVVELEEKAKKEKPRLSATVLKPMPDSFVCGGCASFTDYRVLKYVVSTGDGVTVCETCFAESRGVLVPQGSLTRVLPTTGVRFFDDGLLS